MAHKYAYPFTLSPQSHSYHSSLSTIIRTYNELWRETMTMVIHLLDVESSSFPPPHQSLPSPAVKSRSTGGDKPPESSSTPPYISTASMYHHYATLYISYLSTLRNLEDCYDQMAHPQKRKEVISMLDAVMGRLLEVYDILILLCGTEYVSFLHNLLFLLIIFISPSPFSFSLSLLPSSLT